jgi:1-acyl-sn-glycerol-3-phosphate acyltransferase
MTVDPKAETLLPRWLVHNRNFLLLWAAYGCSAVADHLSEMALLVERDALGSERATRIQALITFGFFVPFVILGPLAGWWADRFNRKWTMFGTDLLRAAFMLSLIWTVSRLVNWLEPHGLGDYAVVLPLLLVGTLAAFFSPSRQALLPPRLRPDQLVRANALISALGTIGTILSAVLGGLIVKHWGLRWNYSLSAATFMFSALLLLFLSMSRARVLPHAPLNGVWAPVRAGFSYVRHHRRVLEMILLGTVFWAAAGIVISAVPALVRDVFGGDIADAGIYRGLIGIGLATGAAIMTVIGPAMPIPLAVLLSLAAGVFWLFCLAQICAWRVGAVPAGICLVGVGVAGAGLLVTIMATIQRFVPDSRRGRVFGVTDMCTMAAIVLTTGLLGLPQIPYIDAYVPGLLAAAGLGLAIALWVAWRRYRQDSEHPAIVQVLLLLIRFYADLWLRTKRIGPCTVPRSGPVILALNHTSGVDPLAVLATCRHRLAGFIVAQEYYRLPILGWFQQQLACLPVDRARPTKSFLTSSLRRLDEGGCVAIFPEGALPVPGQQPHDVKAGVGVLALRTDAVVIPCHISGTSPAPRLPLAYLRPHNIRVRYGRPVDLTALRAGPRNRLAARQASELIMAKVRELGEQAEDRGQ